MPVPSTTSSAAAPTAAATVAASGVAASAATGLAAGRDGLHKPYLPAHVDGVCVFSVAPLKTEGPRVLATAPAADDALVLAAPGATDAPVLAASAATDTPILAAPAAADAPVLVSPPATAVPEPMPGCVVSPRKLAEKTSKYYGVHFAVNEKRWVAQIMVDGRQRWLGNYLMEEDAARAYDKALAEALESHIGW